MTQLAAVAVAACCLLALALPAAAAVMPKASHAGRGSAAAVDGLLARVLGIPAAEVASPFELSIVEGCSSPPPEGQGRSMLCFELGPGSAADKVSVKGTSGVELARGAAHYLRTRCNMSFAWQRTGAPVLPLLINRVAQREQLNGRPFRRWESGPVASRRGVAGGRTGSGLPLGGVQLLSERGGVELLLRVLQLGGLGEAHRLAGACRNQPWAGVHRPGTAMPAHRFASQHRTHAAVGRDVGRDCLQLKEARLAAGGGVSEDFRSFRRERHRLRQL